MPGKFVTAMLKNNGTSRFALKGSSAQSGSLTTMWDGGLPGNVLGVTMTTYDVDAAGAVQVNVTSYLVVAQDPSLVGLVEHAFIGASSLR